MGSNPTAASFFFVCFHILFYNFSSDTYIEVLDSTRIHPETYEWARKMAVDALEYDEVSDYDRLFIVLLRVAQ